MMTGIITRKVQTGNYQTLIREGGNALLKRSFFFMEADQESADKQTGAVFYRISKINSV